MAEEKDEIESIPGEDSEEELSGGGGDPEEDQDTESREIPEDKDPGPSPKRYRKWILLSVPLLILAISGVAIRLGPGFSNILQDEVSFTESVDIDNVNLTEEILAPFFIPPSTVSSRDAIRIDFSVIWDGLASIRFKKKALQVRSDLLELITDLSEETDDLNKDIPSLERKMSLFVQKELGVTDLAIKIKEIRYL